MSKINNKIKQDIFLYVMFLGLSYIFYKVGIIKDCSIYLIILLLVFFIKDILKYFYEFNTIAVEKVNYFKLFTNKTVKNIELFLVLNRNIVFPSLLVIYMIYLLIKQTHLWWLQKYISNVNELQQNILLWVVIISGILTVFKEDIDKKYLEKKHVYPWFHIILTIVLSVLWTYIIFNQVVKLWNLAYVISLISGLLIFLVWISILEDEK